MPSAASAEDGLAPAKEPDPDRPPAESRPNPATTKPKSAPVDFSHRGQILASIRFGLGLRAVVPYEEATYCGETSNDTSSGYAPACIGRAPFSLDFELGYGLTSRIDLLFELRVGIEPDFDSTPAGDDGPRPFHLSPGARFFFNEDAKTKIFTTAQLVVDVATYKSSNGADIGSDFGVRNLTGIWFDLDRAYGFYLYAGPTASFARWFRFELEGGIGIQARFR